MTTPIRNAIQRTRFPNAFRRIRRLPGRFRFAFSYLKPHLVELFRWTLSSREVANFTYDLEPLNERYLASVISLVTGYPQSTIAGYFAELKNDEGLRAHIRSRTQASSFAGVSDPIARYGRRIGWYAFTRCLKPRVVVETGVDKGLGGCVLCRALERNRTEGYPGEYFGTDIHPSAGWLLEGLSGTVLYGDSIESLKKLDRVDLFINDSDHSEDYEAREYEVIADKLSANAVILGDNAHVTDALMRFSEARRRKFIFWSEKPARHWYPGAGIGISFTETTARN